MRNKIKKCFFTIPDVDATYNFFLGIGIIEESNINIGESSNTCSISYSLLA